ncbi:methyl-accepting chemotaxis sensory transducer [Geobacter metallireducens RCH3]|uniref:Methyl-accepting chemotaxis sensory transducer, class 34H-related protein n=1 Tax=Geobacter metallireducens (strain ATCC 53774 / DSM 7210 / GS-15) TaxID=269799 RepID=Q39SW9_GEOMG|nr:methyl-accepting chemotaxis protein [Geobacter metallireducens]ABB32655.1 methyl-accepting chemotaxis sensory transducer, class 34H-related protein [Geobacter metallireducens GS-15]EHP87852.1 methyl-accepting chemotaxis sensory transducer [Geobacter metallireducens RCH3]
MTLAFFRRFRPDPDQSEAAIDASSPLSANQALSAQFEPWHQQLLGIGGRLSLLNGSTEEEFLAIGARLHDFYGRAGEIEEMSRQVADLILGDEISRDMAALHGIVDRIADYLSRAEAESDQSATTLKTILSHISNVDEPLDGFRKIIKNLHMISTSVKIESARLGEGAAGFNTLADDVERLSVSIKEKSVAILGEKETLSSMIGGTLARVTASEVEQRKNVRHILDKTRESLVTLTEIHGRCSEAVGVVTSSSAETAGSIAEVVTSLQFHDITRQQIEHVKEALDDLIPNLTDQAGDPVKNACEVADVCELQEAQLRHAREELSSAVARIVENLRAIACRQTRLSDETRHMAGTADRAGSSFFADMENGMGRVTEVLSDNAAANRNLASAMETVMASVQDIAGFVTTIEEIGSEIELIALNSQVKAANTGDGGAALGVLAEAIQHLSVEARTRTGAVSDTLRNVTEVTGGLSHEVDTDVRLIAEEVDGFIGEIRNLVGSVRGVNERLIDLLGRIDAAVQALSRDIDQATGVMTVHETSTALIDEVLAEITGVVGAVRPFAPATAAHAKELRLRELADRYTMHSERRVHDAMIAGNGARVEPTPDLFAAAAGGAADDGLGDNVELF